jgi:hypothetical protein
MNDEQIFRSKIRHLLIIEPKATVEQIERHCSLGWKPDPQYDDDRLSCFRRLRPVLPADWLKIVAEEKLRLLSTYCIANCRSRATNAEEKHASD